MTVQLGGYGLVMTNDDDDDDTNDVDQLVGAALPSGAVSCTLHTRLLPI